MKRSRNDANDWIAIKAKNDLIPIGFTRSPGQAAAAAPKKKCQKTCAVNCFDWLPEEMVQQILEQVSWKLDGVLRLVHSTWYKAMDRRWDPKARLVYTGRIRCWLYPDIIKPCIDWALCHHNLSLLKWAVSDMKMVPPNRIDADEGSLILHACRKGDTHAILWLTREIQPVPASGGIRPIKLTDEHVYAAAEGPSLSCFLFVIQKSALRFPDETCAYRACRAAQENTMAWIMSTYVYKNGKKQNPNYPPVFISCLENACRSGSIPMVDWVMSHGKSHADMVGVIEATSECVEYALGYGHVKLAKHLVNRWKCPVNVMAVLAFATDSKNLEIMQCALDITPAKIRGPYRKCYFDLEYFVEHRHFDVLNRLVKKMDLHLYQAFTRAVQDDDQSLAMLDWLWLHCDHEVVRNYIGGGGIPVEIDSDTVYFYGKLGAEKDHQEVWDWLKAHNLADHLFI